MVRLQNFPKLVRVSKGDKCYNFLVRTSKILIRLNVPTFSRFSTSKYSYFVLIFYETFLPAVDENYFLRS